MTVNTMTNKAILSIAIVDDDWRICKAVEALIDGITGLRCEGIYHNFATALSGFRQSKPDIVLLDIGLPDTSGLDGIPTIRTEFPAMKIIMHSNYNEDEKIFQAKHAGASGYVLKNQSFDILHNAILQVNTGKTVWPSGYDDSMISPVRSISFLDKLIGWFSNR